MVCVYAGIERELASRADQIVLRWFGHVGRMDEYSMARRVLMEEVSGGRVRGRPRLGWMDGVKVELGSRGMVVEATRRCMEWDDNLKSARFLFTIEHLQHVFKKFHHCLHRYSDVSQL